MNDLEDPKPGMARRIASWARDHTKAILLAAGFLILALWALRGYIPALGGSRLPPSIVDKIERGYRVCIMDIVIWPGETRQPSCGEVRIVLQTAGIVGEVAKATGITRAVCYKVDISTPYWTTERTTRHEVVWHGRRVSKVAVLQSGGWLIFPDTDEGDSARWAEFACPLPYEAGAMQDVNPV